jgi:1,4-dihydroxy-2-naphthoate octaprenyltransferase
MRARDWVRGARPRTLPAAIVPVAVGTGAAVGQAEIDASRAGAALVVALFLQIGTNFANDYHDGVRGTDDDRVGPVRLVGSGRVDPDSVKQAAIAAFAVAAAAGVWLAAVAGWGLLVVGAASLAAGWLYTGGPRPYGYLALGELFVFIFFGLVATVGSTYVQTGAVSGLAVAAAVPVGFLATALLVINNLRDIPTDTSAGKRTLAVVLGDMATRWLYVALIVGVFVIVPAIAAARPWAGLAWLAIPLSLAPISSVMAGASGADLIGTLGATGRLQLVFGGLLALGLALSG